MASKNIIEQLHRIEHKLDILLEAMAIQNPYTVIRPVGDQEHACPVCHMVIQYMPDIIAGEIVRKCGCSTGMMAPNAPTSLTTPQQGPSNAGTEE